MSSWWEDAGERGGDYQDHWDIAVREWDEIMRDNERRWEGYLDAAAHEPGDEAEAEAAE